jgi:hypothetical protein
MSDIKNKDIMRPADILGIIHSCLVSFAYQSIANRRDGKKEYGQ